MYCTCVLSAEKFPLSRMMLEQSTTCCDKLCINSTVSMVRFAFRMMLRVRLVFGVYRILRAMGFCWEAVALLEVLNTPESGSSVG